MAGAHRRDDFLPFRQEIKFLHHRRKEKNILLSYPFGLCATIPDKSVVTGSPAFAGDDDQWVIIWTRRYHRLLSELFRLISGAADHNGRATTCRPSATFLP
jgi:hypothetical protein